MSALQTSEMKTLNLLATAEMSAVQAGSDLRQRALQLESSIGDLLHRYSLTLLRLSIGICFIWFGALKFDAGLSPAEPLIRDAITFLPMAYFLPFLALWEVMIGVGYMSGKFTRVVVALMLMQMGGAMSPIVLAPDRIFATFPYALTLEGQYIIKDLILISAALVVAAATFKRQPAN